ncbi:hypothetical protein JCM10450v2_005382 [Rhodotorula kratochvilovae]
MLPALLLLLATPALALPAPFFDARAATALPLAEDALASEAAVSFIAYFPRITSPAKGDSFTAGGALEVAWNATKPNYPDNQIHTFAQVFLGFLDDEDPSSGYNLDVENPLGNVSFYGGSGRASLPLPADLKTRSTYLITMGSTNNISPLFTIQAAQSSSPSPSSSSSAAAAPSSSTSAAPASSTTSSAQIEARPITVYFPDGESTVLGGGAASSTSAAAAPAETTLRDVAAGNAAPSSAAAAEAKEPASLADATSSSAAAAAASSSPAAASSPSPSSAVGSAPSAAAAAAGSSTTSGAGRTLFSTVAVAFAGLAAFAVL